MSNIIDVVVASFEAVILGSPNPPKANPTDMDKSKTSLELNKNLCISPSTENRIKSQPRPSEKTTSVYSIQDDILSAAKETSMCRTNNENLPDSISRFNFFLYCQRKHEIKKLQSALAEEPSLASIRQTKGDLYQGQTPLHTAAMHANVEAVKILLNAPNISAWSRDLYGRTPLHLAAIHLHLQGSIEKMSINEVTQCCTLLRDAMINERGIDPVGIHAPADLAGMSPMGWVNRESKGNASPALKSLLFRPGDISVLPVTPTRTRGGQSSPMMSSAKSVNMASARMKYLTMSHAKSSAAHTARKGIDSSLFSPSELADRGISSSLLGASTSSSSSSSSSSSLPSSSQATNSSHSKAATAIQVISSDRTVLHMSGIDNDTTPVKAVTPAHTAMHVTTTPPTRVLSTESPAATEHPVPAAMTASATATTAAAAAESSTLTTHYTSSSDGKILYGYSTANGWRDSMEDKVTAVCPLTLCVPAHKHQSYSTTVNSTSSSSSSSGSSGSSITKTHTVDEVVYEEIEVGLFCLCDGHGGSYTARYITENVSGTFSKQFHEQYTHDRNRHINDFLDENIDDDNIILTDIFWTQVLTAVCESLETQLRESPKMKFPEQASEYGKKTAKDSSGATAVITLVTGSAVYVANVGDSRAVLCTTASTSTASATSGATGVVTSPNSSTTNNTAASTTTGAVGGHHPPQSVIISSEPLSYDHKFHRSDMPEECARADACGAKLSPYESEGYLEVAVPSPSDPEKSNILRMSRSFGDFIFKRAAEVPLEQQAVVAVPDITVHPRINSDMFLVMASDGVWDVMTNDEAVQFVYDTLVTISQSMSITVSGSNDSYHNSRSGIGGSSHSGVSGSGSSADSTLPPLLRLLSSGKHSSLAVDVLAQTCDKLLEKSLERGSVDNMSVILVWLNSVNGSSTSMSTSEREVEEEEKEWISELNAAAKKLFE